MSVTSLPGTGFTRIELSQAFVDIACSDNGASNLNNDGMLWSGMKYSCVTVGWLVLQWWFWHAQQYSAKQ
jgi:hypothetical protein